jgi:hypothetical protein
MPAFDQLNVATRDYVKEGAVELVDNVFQQDELTQRLKGNAKPFPGGTQITEPLVARGLVGGAYQKGGKFNTDERQTDQHLRFDMKYMYVGVTVDKIDVQVLNRGPKAIYPIIKSKMKNATMTMGANMAISAYLPGAVSGGSYEHLIAGLPVALNDNSANAWTAATYADYGELSRSGQWYSDAVKGNCTVVGGAITYETLEDTLMTATFGAEAPKLGATTPKLYSYIKNKFQSQQRFNESNPSVGFRGLDFQGTVILPSRYCPGSAISAASTGPEAQFITESTRTSASPLTAYPSVTGETLFWLNPDYINLYISTDDEYGLGFTGFKPGRDDDSLVGQLKLAWCLTVPGPRFHHEVNQITG